MFYRSVTKLSLTIPFQKMMLKFIQAVLFLKTRSWLIHLRLQRTDSGSASHVPNVKQWV